MSEPAPSSNIEKMLEKKRANLTRFTPEQARAEVEKGNGTVLIDTRPQHYRDAEGAIPGAIILERNVLEWRLDPTSPDAIPEAKDPNFKPVLFCNNAYSSSLAADSLNSLGIKGADLIGGYRQWKQDGMPTGEAPKERGPLEGTLE